MPVISQNAFAPRRSGRQRCGSAGRCAPARKDPPAGAAHSAQRAGQAAVPVGVPAIDALLPEGGLLTGALHEIEAGPAPSGRVAPHDGAALGFAAHLLGRFASLKLGGTLLWCRRPFGRLRCAALRAGAGRLVRSGAAAAGDGAARRGPVLGAGRGPALSRHRRRPGRDARRRCPRPAGGCRSPPRKAACPPCCCGPNLPRRKASARRAGASPRPPRPRPRGWTTRPPALARRAQAQPLRPAVGRGNPDPGSWSGTMKRIVSLWFPKLATDRLAQDRSARPFDRLVG